MSVNKQHILRDARAEYERWEALLAGLPEAQHTAPDLADGWSVKDVLAHLRAWQQRSIARLEAGLEDHEPVFPAWPTHLQADTEAGVQAVNVWVYETQREHPWDQVYHDWRAGFLRFLALGEAIPEADLLENGRYPWWKDYTLAFVITASVDHHREHYEWLDRAGLTEDK